ncbi:MAG TPA: hypothetical protein VN867_01725 [Candidatus Binataceae bacterium]|nr:hypothetical protein [Candidatus Binataceae bacterium]
MKIAGIFTQTLIAGAVATLLLGGTALAGTGTPEIDPGMATGGLTILGVGIVLLLERYRRS